MGLSGHDGGTFFPVIWSMVQDNDIEMPVKHARFNLFFSTAFFHQKIREPRYHKRHVFLLQPTQETRLWQAHACSPRRPVCVEPEEVPARVAFHRSPVQLQ